MSETPPTPEGHRTTDVPAPRRSRRLAAALPYGATAVVAVLCSVIIQIALSPASAPTTPQDSSTSASQPVPTETVTPTVLIPSTLPANESGLRLAILDLEATDRRLWSAIYLLRAASQIDDAVVALQSNNVDEVDRILLNTRRSFDRAYVFSAEQEKGPIDTLRLQVGQARDDLHLRPEGLDRSLRQIRRLVLSLVDESGGGL